MSSIRALPHVVIVGGGISGLAAAYYLEQRARAAGQPLSYTLLERAPRLGGKILSERIDGFGDEPFVVEGGPDSFMTQKPWALQLARAVGLTDDLLGTNDHTRKTYVLHRAHLKPLPDGVQLIVPTRFMPFVQSTLISPAGKLRMGMDYFIPARQDDGDETLADFIRRRLGDEALDKIAEPLMSGIYNAEAERQSVLATFPRFRELEKKHGSLIKGMLASRTSGAHAAASGAGNGARPLSVFMSLRYGTQQLVEGLTAQLGGALRPGVGAAAIEPAAAGGYRLTLTDGSALDADLVILAAPTYVGADLLQAIAPDAAAGLRSIRYVSTGTVSLAYRRSELSHPLNGFGVVIPRSERRPINAITWSSTKFNHRAPDGYALIRVFFGGSRNPQMMEKDDQALLDIVQGELRALMGINATPIFTRIYRWHLSNPQYDVGHLERVAAIEAALPPNIVVTGSPYRGVGIPDCVHQGEQAAERALRAILGY